VSYEAESETEVWSKSDQQQRWNGGGQSSHRGGKWSGLLKFSEIGTRYRSRCQSQNLYTSYTDWADQITILLQINLSLNTMLDRYKLWKKERIDKQDSERVLSFLAWKNTSSSSEKQFTSLLISFEGSIQRKRWEIKTKFIWHPVNRHSGLLCEWVTYRLSITLKQRFCCR